MAKCSQRLHFAPVTKKQTGKSVQVLQVPLCFKNHCYFSPSRRRCRDLASLGGGRAAVRRGQCVPSRPCVSFIIASNQTAPLQNAQQREEEGGGAHYPANTSALLHNKDLLYIPLSVRHRPTDPKKNHHCFFHRCDKEKTKHDCISLSHPPASFCHPLLASPGAACFVSGESNHVGKTIKGKKKSWGGGWGGVQKALLCV